MKQKYQKIGNEAVDTDAVMNIMEDTFIDNNNPLMLAT